MREVAVVVSVEGGKNTKSKDYLLGGLLTGGIRQSGTIAFSEILPYRKDKEQKNLIVGWTGYNYADQSFGIRTSDILYWTSGYPRTWSEPGSVNLNMIASRTEIPSELFGIADLILHVRGALSALLMLDEQGTMEIEELAKTTMPEGTEYEVISKLASLHLVNLLGKKIELHPRYRNMVRRLATDVSSGR